MLDVKKFYFHIFHPYEIAPRETTHFNQSVVSPSDLAHSRVLGLRGKIIRRVFLLLFTGGAVYGTINRVKMFLQDSFTVGHENTTFLIIVRLSTLSTDVTGPSD